jgi:hypothetical protein
MGMHGFWMHRFWILDWASSHHRIIASSQGWGRVWCNLSRRHKYFGETRPCKASFYKIRIIKIIVIWEHPIFAKIVTLTPLTPLTHEGRGGKNKELSPHPKVVEALGVRGITKMGYPL